MTSKQPLLDELHAIREHLLASSGGTLAGLVARLRSEQANSGRTILDARRTSQRPAAVQLAESQVEVLTSPVADR